MLVYALYSRGFDDDDILEWMESSANCESAYWCAEYVNERRRTRNIIFIVSARCFVAVRRSLSSQQRYRSSFLGCSYTIITQNFMRRHNMKNERVHFHKNKFFIHYPLGCLTVVFFLCFCDDFMVNKCDSTSHFSSFARALRFLLISLVDLRLFPLLLDRCCCCAVSEMEKVFFCVLFGKVWYSHLEQHSRASSCRVPHHLNL